MWPSFGGNHRNNRNDTTSNASNEENAAPERSFVDLNEIDLEHLTPDLLITTLREHAAKGPFIAAATVIAVIDRSDANEHPACRLSAQHLATLIGIAGTGMDKHKKKGRDTSNGTERIKQNRQAEEYHQVQLHLMGLLTARFSRTRSATARQ
jgi:hypothetical protein